LEINDQRSTGRRRQQLLALVRSSEFVRVPELSLRLGVSKVTIRNDLDVLAKRGQVVRVPGGAIPNASPSERAFEARQAVASDAKTAIGEAAVDLISPGNTVILDVGTTTMAIARALIARADLRGVVVFTNALNIALALEGAIPRIEVFVTGGALRPIQHSLVEPGATNLLAQIRADYAFVGCDAIHPVRGVTTTNLPEAAMKQAMIRAAQRVVIVADSSKFLRESMTRVCGLEELDFILTAGELAPDVLPAFADTGVEIRAVPAIGTGSGAAEVGS
jgi:DeoR family transcriptional regulator of aga operon